jgi:hypothetical protein
VNTELFERAAGAGAQLLRVDKRVHSGDARASALLFTFDVGRILVAADPARGALVATHVESSETSSTALLDASEDEPWWRLLGAPLSAAQGTPDGTQLELRFRMGEGRLREAVLRLDAARVDASLRDAA